MKFSKLKDESGSTMLLAIFLMVLVSIIIISFSVQVGNQIKSTKNADDGIQEKYDAESEIEEGISRFINSIGLSKQVEPWIKRTADKYGKVIETHMTYEYFIITYDRSIVKKIDINPSINMIDSSHGTIIIDADDDLENNNPETENKPHGSISSIIDLETEFIGNSKEKSLINIQVSNIVNQKNYKVSYSVLSWRVK